MAINMEVRAGDGVGPVRVGMTPEEVRRALLGERLRSTERTENYQGTGITVPSRDIFTALRLRVEYRDGVCVAIEVAQPAVPVLDGVRVLQTPFQWLLGWLAQRDSALRVDDAGCTSLELGVGIYAPDWRQNPSVPPEGLIVFRRGYYEEDV